MGGGRRNAIAIAFCILYVAQYSDTFVSSDHHQIITSRLVLHSIELNGNKSRRRRRRRPVFYFGVSSSVLVLVRAHFSFQLLVKRSGSRWRQPRITSFLFKIQIISP